MIEAYIRVIHDAALVSAWISDASHRPGKDKLEPFLLALFGVRHARIEAKLRWVASKDAHHQTLSEVRVARDALNLLIEVFQRLKCSLSIVAVVEKPPDLGRKAGMYVSFIKWMNGTYAFRVRLREYVRTSNNTLKVTQLTVH